MHQPAHAAQRRGSRPCQVCPGRVRGKRSLEPLPPPVGTRAFVDPSGSHGGRRCAGRQAGRMTSAPAVGSPAPIDAGGRPGEAITNDPIRAAANERSPPTKPEPPKQRARRQHARGMGHPDQLAAPERAKLSPTGTRRPGTGSQAGTPVFGCCAWTRTGRSAPEENRQRSATGFPVAACAWSS